MKRRRKAPPLHCCICQDEVYRADCRDQSAIYDSGRCPNCGTELIEAPRWVAVTVAIFLGALVIGLTLKGVL